MNSERKFRILSIDGGGLRGVIPLQIIRYIEEITGEEIHNSFDLIAGTSTGGLLTCALTFQDADDIEGGQRKYSLDEIEKIYVERGNQIFPSESYFSFKKNPLKKWLYPKYNPTSLDNILGEYFGDARVTNCMKPIFITSYDIHRNKPVFFTTREATLIPERNPKLKDICRATSAAPTYFPSYRFSYDKENIVCVDGGVFMNNPSLGALIEILGNLNYKYYKVKERMDLSDIFILSLGTGTSNKVLNSLNSESWGRINWIKPIIDLTTNGPVKVINDQLKTIYEMFGHEDNYLRINIDIEEKYSEMSDARKEVSDYLIRETKSQILMNETLRLKLELLLEGCGIKTKGK
jgi:patatin-like phospholipase/acyl hydrolase